MLSLDVGSTSVRAMVFDALGRAVKGYAAARPTPLRSGADGSSEAAAREILAAVCGCVDEILAAARGRSLAAVGSCTFVSNLLGLDARGRPVGPITTYADTRAAAAARGLRAENDEAAAHERTGCRFHPSYWPARLRWLAAERPDSFRRARSWVSLAEYLQAEFFGATAAMSVSVASWTGLLDRRLLGWDAELARVAGLDLGQLPELAGAGTPKRGLKRAYARRWPALREVPWCPAVGDGAAGNIGSGCFDSQRIALSLGTTAALRVVLPGAAPAIPDGLWCYRVDRRRHLLGGALSEGGCVYAWLMKTLRLDEKTAARELAKAQPGAHGLVVLPFLAGERSPGWAEDARAAFTGLSLATRPEDMLHAGLEAVALRLALVLERLAPACPGAQIVASGGALLRSPTWARIIADATGRSLTLSKVPEASCRGAALLALEGIGALSDVAQALAYTRRVFEPDPARHALYRAALNRQQELYGRLIGP